MIGKYIFIIVVVVFKLSIAFIKKSTTLRVHLRVIATSSLRYSQFSSHPTFPKLSSVLKASSVQSRTPPLRDLHLPEVFPIPKVSKPNQIFRSSVHQDLHCRYVTPSSPCWRHVTPQSGRLYMAVDSPFMQCWLINANKHRCCNKSSICRSCSYNHPPIQPLRQHSCQVHKILLHLGEEDRSLP